MPRMSEALPAYWNSFAPSFDDWPDHGLRDPEVRAAWADLLDELMPVPPARVADLGCGTGSLSVLLASRGHRVAGVDFAPEMIDAARRKADLLGVPVEFAVGDAGTPALPPGSVDVVLARHVVWALPDPSASLRRWVDLLASGGRLVLVEGYWFTDGGLHADELLEILEPMAYVRSTRALTDPRLWGGAIDDERYAVVAEPRESPGPAPG